MIAFPKESEDSEPESDRGSGGDSIATLAEFTRSDLVMIRSLASRGLIDGERMAGMTDDIAHIVENPDAPQRMRIAAFKALAVLQVGLMKLLGDLHLRPAAAVAGTTNNNQQINIYLPANDRDASNGHLTNGQNGKH